MNNKSRHFLMYEWHILLENKGLIVGAIFGVLRGLSDLKLGRFRPVFALADFLGSVLMGYVAWEITSQSNIPTWAAYSFTVVMALNWVVVLSVLSDKHLITVIISRWFKIDRRGNEID